ncbi:3-hydroxyacyl-CoA dehydrogenase family protein [Zhengella sp. ZM62]|uniref:3-hydroxyacyl-CoA dehydrogenase family protein n=1 Tax=Zhengella sedimenti TaxID=3390035 RepID=UPI0039752F37
MLPDAGNAKKGVGVVGAGTMGVGIAYVFAMAGHPVVVVEPDGRRSVEARATMEQAAGDAVRRGKISADDARRRLASIRFAGAVSELPVGMALVIETVPERLDIKHRVLAGIDGRSPAIIATNTSALSIDDLAAAVSRPDAFIGMHFFNPVWSLHLVELVRGTATSDETLATATAFATGIGKKTAVVSDRPGFITSRLDLILALEAIRMVEEGVASPNDIDVAITTAYRHPVGPLRLTDLVGLDVRLDIARHLGEAIGPRYAPPRLLEEKVARGELGRKSGHGFYDWSAEADAGRAGQKA